MSRNKPPVNIVEQRDEWQEWVAEGRELAEQRASVHAQATAAQQQWQETLAEHERAVQDAIANRAVVPRSLEQPDDHLLDAIGRLRFAQQRHNEREQAVLATIAADGGVEAARERIRVITANARTPAAEMQAAVQDVRQTLVLLARLLRADDQVHRGQVVSRVAHAVDERALALTADEVIDAVLNGRPLAEVQPVVSASMFTDGDEEAHISLERAREANHRRLIAAGQPGLGTRPGTE